MNCKGLLAFLSDNFTTEYLEYGVKKSAPSGAGVEIIDIEQLESASVLRNHTSYIVKAGDAFKESLPDCLIACGELPAWLDEAKVHRLFIIRSSNSESVFSLCKNRISLENEVSAASSGLYSSMLKGIKLSDLVNLAAESLNNPIIIYDSNYKILFYSDNYEMNDPVWDAGVMEKMTVAPDHVREMEEGRGTRPNSTEGFRFLCPRSPYERLVSFIIHEHIVCGNVLMLQ